MVSKKQIKMQGKEGVDGNGDSSGGKKFTKSVTFNAVGAHPPKFTVEPGDFIPVAGSWRAIINAGGVAVSESELKLFMSENVYKEVGGGGEKALEETLSLSTTVKAEAGIGGVKASAEATVSSSLKGTISNYFSNKSSTASERNNSISNKVTCKVPPQKPEYTIWAWTNQAIVMKEMVTNNTCLYACTKTSTIPPAFRLGEVENTCPGLNPPESKASTPAAPTVQ
jgi:hypothetical protein